MPRPKTAPPGSAANTSAAFDEPALMSLTLHLQEADGRQVTLTGRAGQSLMRAALAAGVDGIAADCGGCLNCATCHVIVDAEWLPRLPAPAADELAMLEMTAAPREPHPGTFHQREKGTYFERLTKVWLEHAPTQRQQFARVLTFGDWAKENRFDQRDTGIDLAAQLADSPDDWCAVQGKFYAEGCLVSRLTRL